MLDIKSVINVFKISRLQSIRECCRVIQSITECYKVLQSVAECYRVLQSVTKCYRVLQSVTEYKSSASTWTNFWACFHYIKA